MEQPWIASTTARAAIAWISQQASADALRIGSELQRRFDLTPKQRAEVLTQAELAARAASRWRQPTDALLFTRDGLEQASRPAVAAWRAARLAGLGVHAIADLGCGLGLESRAFAQAGMHVHAVELDPRTAGLASANLDRLDASVAIGDVTDPRILSAALDGVDAVFLDPARRDPAAPRSIDGLSGHRVADPKDWSPPWPWIESLAARMPRTVVKVAPGIDHTLVPDGGSAVWVSVDGDLVEASVWFPGFEGLAPRAALSIAMGATAMLDSGMPTYDAIGEMGGYLLDVAPVVTRSGLVTTLAESARAHRIDEHVGYLSCADAPAPSPFYTTYRVLEVLPFDRKRVGDALFAAGAGALTVTKRAFAADTEVLRRQWLKRCTGDRSITVALTRIDEHPTAIICER